MSARAAAVEATRRRFRPILMTSIAFILGVVPLLTATGAGSASQQSLGTVVFGGMLASTLLAIPFVPVFYIVMQGVGERLGGRARLASRSLKFPEKAPEMDGSRTHRLP
jgi:hydrophobic/amphiphilic exporter-1 (mainly G- bacteria), HAE1 family